jgi:hypothetical protein
VPSHAPPPKAHGSACADGETDARAHAYQLNAVFHQKSGELSLSLSPGVGLGAGNPTERSLVRAAVIPYRNRGDGLSLGR